MGIGTTAPGATLDVSGVINASLGLTTSKLTTNTTINSPAGVRENFISNLLTGSSTNWFIGFDNWVTTTTDYSNPSYVWGTENVLRIGDAGGTAGGMIANAIGQNNAIQVVTGVTVTSARGMDISVTSAGGTITQGKGINITAVAGGANNSWGIYDSSGAAEYFAGNVGIGTLSPQYPLSVNGTIQAKEVLVNTGWSDYVFDSNYRLAPLPEVAAYVAENHHLPGIPSAAEVAEKGISVGDMQSRLLAKIEELTLHMIQTEKDVAQTRQENRELKERLEKLGPRREEHRLEAGRPWKRYRNAGGKSTSADSWRTGTN